MKSLLVSYGTPQSTPLLPSQPVLLLFSSSSPATSPHPGSLLSPQHTRPAPVAVALLGIFFPQYSPGSHPTSFRSHLCELFLDEPAEYIVSPSPSLTHYLLSLPPWAPQDLSPSNKLSLTKEVEDYFPLNGSPGIFIWLIL